MGYAMQSKKVTYKKTHKLPEKKQGKELLRPVRTRRIKKAGLQ